jgi:hypothetical protein
MLRRESSGALSSDVQVHNAGHSGAASQEINLCLRRLRWCSVKQAHNQQDDKYQDEYEEQGFCDTCRRGSDAAETKQRSDYRDYKEDNSPSQKSHTQPFHYRRVLQTEVLTGRCNCPQAAFPQPALYSTLIVEDRKRAAIGGNTKFYEGYFHCYG